MLTKLIAFAVTGGLAAKALKLWIDRERAQCHARAQRERALEIQRWENEGGNPAPTAQPANA